MTWFSSLSYAKRISVLAGAIVTVLGALTAIANALKAGEPYWIATRGFVAERVAENTTATQVALADASTRQIGIEIRIEQAERRRIQAKISDLQLELSKSPDAPLTLRRLIEDQLNQYRDELAEMDSAIMELRRAQTQMRR